MERAGLEVNQLYSELRRIAISMMRRERSGHTLQATALANEAVLSLGADVETWENRAHFFGAAAQAMRRVLVQHARSRLTQKRGGAAERVTFDELQLPGAEPETGTLLVKRALDELGREHPALKTLVEMRYFDGFSLEEVAEATGRSIASVKRDWTEAREWLRRYLTA